MFKQGEGGGLKNSDLALPEGSIAKRRGLEVGKELTKWVLPRPLTSSQVGALYTTRLASFQRESCSYLYGAAVKSQ